MTRSLFTIPLLVLAGALISQAAHAQPHTTLYNFTGGADGADPLGGVIEDATGTLYGETLKGGTTACTSNNQPEKGCGTVYRWNPASGFAVLATFTGPNGAHGNASLARRGTTLYGVTRDGGANDDGIVFSVSTSGANFTFLHTFAGPDGTTPVAIVLGSTGTIYGIAQAGGASTLGVIFSLTPTGTYTILHDFGPAAAGAAPNSLVIAANGTLVGSTLYGGGFTPGCQKGCGTVFTDDPTTGTFRILYSFPGSSKIGEEPYIGSLGPGPTIYASQAFAAFSLSASGYTNLGTYNFYGSGDGPQGGPVYTPGGTLYGLLDGNAGGGYGTLYSLKNGVFTSLTEWDGTSDGGIPRAQPFLTTTNTLIGTATQYGNCLDCGTIWQYGPLPQ